LRRPELVDEYKILAARYLREAMSKGHAEAYLAMSQAVYDGIVIDTDLPLAYAYLERAESLTTNINILAAISSRKIEIAQYLDRDQILQAESIAERL
jgi:TPR repeat protein